MNGSREAFASQAEHCRALGSGFMGQLMDVLAARLTPETSPLAARLFAWDGDIGPKAASLPLRLAGGLHALVLRGAQPSLAATYPPNAATDDALWAAVREALEVHDTWLDLWIESPPQTNEIRRSAVLRAGGQWIAARWGLPLEVLELGASAGLNLHWDAFGMQIGGTVFGPLDAVLRLTPEWNGPLPPAFEPEIVARRGVDLAPPDTTKAEDRLRLLAYLWPDQPERLARTRAALALPNPEVDAGDAVDWLQGQLARPHPGRVRVICHTIAWQYFPEQVQARGKAMIEAAGARATPDAPLVWFGMEPDTGTRGAAVTLRQWPGNETLTAGRACFHGRWVDWALDAPENRSE